MLKFISVCIMLGGLLLTACNAAPPPAKLDGAGKLMLAFFYTDG